MAHVYRLVAGVPERIGEVSLARWGYFICRLSSFPARASYVFDIVLIASRACSDMGIESCSANHSLNDSRCNRARIAAVGRRTGGLRLSHMRCDPLCLIIDGVFVSPENNGRALVTEHTFFLFLCTPVDLVGVGVEAWKVALRGEGGRRQNSQESTSASYAANVFFRARGM